ncbi:MAG: hypothetical protein J6W04_00760 [Bacteroidales bacterium]|nr:hypothetical protein [Bacteroidales bacterium]
MTHRDWIATISKEEIAFRMYGKEWGRRRCDECVFYKQTADGYSCTGREYEVRCKQEYNDWLDEEME